MLRDSVIWYGDGQASPHARFTGRTQNAFAAVSIPPILLCGRPLTYVQRRYAFLRDLDVSTSSQSCFVYQRRRRLFIHFKIL